MAGSGWTHLAPQSSKQSHTLPPTQFDNKALIRKKKALHVHELNYQCTLGSIFLN